MSEAADILARIDAIAEALTELRAEVERQGGGYIVPIPSGNGLDRDEELLEVSTASARFNRPADSLRWLCRHENVGRKIGGRWMVSPARLRARLERE